MLAIRGGRIFTMDHHGIIENGVIFIADGRIQAVGPDVHLPDGCRVIDARDGYVTPGFIDAHTHIGLEEEIYRVEGDDVNETTDPLTPQLQACDGINLYDLGFQDALRGGVTRSMCMPGSANIVGGQAVFLKHLAETAGEMICKNPWGLKAALGENPKRVYGEQKKTPVTRMGSASLLREAFYTASRLIENGDPAISRFKWDPVAKVLRKEMPLLLHVHRADDILTALRIKDEYDFDLVLQHGTEAFRVADEIKKRNVPVCLGPLLVNRAKVELKDVSFKNAAALAQMGIDFCIITDHPVIPIEHLRVCAALAAREGLDDTAALAAITSRPARILGVDSELGSITVGKRADIVIFDRHPLEYRSRVRWVVVDGILWGDKHE